MGNILSFRESFPGCTEFILDMNCRSTPQILAVCQRLIAHNTRKIAKLLRTMNPDGSAVQVLAGVNEEDEAIQIVCEIKDLRARSAYSYPQTYAGKQVKRSPFLEEMLSGNAE